jgi:hypothetical protein
MPPTQQGSGKRPQALVPLSEDDFLALRLISLRDEISVPQILKQVVSKFLQERLELDSDLRDSLQKLLTSRRKESARTARTAKVTEIRSKT